MLILGGLTRCSPDGVLFLLRKYPLLRQLESPYLIRALSRGGVNHTTALSVVELDSVVSWNTSLDIVGIIVQTCPKLTKLSIPHLSRVDEIVTPVSRLAKFRFLNEMHLGGIEFKCFKEILCHQLDNGADLKILSFINVFAAVDVFQITSLCPKVFFWFNLMKGF